MKASDVTFVRVLLMSSKRASENYLHSASLRHGDVSDRLIVKQGEANSWKVPLNPQTETLTEMASPAFILHFRLSLQRRYAPLAMMLSVESTAPSTDHQAITKRRRLGDPLSFHTDAVGGRWSFSRPAVDPGSVVCVRTVLFSDPFLPLRYARRYSTAFRVYSGNVWEGLS